MKKLSFFQEVTDKLKTTNHPFFNTKNEFQKIADELKKQFQKSPENKIIELRKAIDKWYAETEKSLLRSNRAFRKIAAVKSPTIVISKIKKKDYRK